MAGPVTFEEAREEFREEREERGEEPFFSGESDILPDREDLEQRLQRLRTILSASPGELADRPDITQPGVSDPLGDITIDIDDIAGGLENAENQLDFLSNIAASNLTLLEIISVLADTQVQTLRTMFDISDFMSPFSRITVSGTNSIEDADVAEPVVPQSDTTSIPTRILFIKAAEDNQEPIAIGDDETSPGNGWVLHKNEHLTLNWNLSGNALYMASAEEDQIVELLGLV